MNQTKTKYEVVIGLEIHAELSTKTKLWCGCLADSFDDPPNTNVCEVCMGFPGSLPVLNKSAVEKAVAVAKALEMEVPEKSIFDRKNYFYPDLPAGYQISQYLDPVCGLGHLDVEVEGEMKRFGITRIHLENDAGKLVHGNSGTKLDFNRAGVPLIEMVTEPDLRSAADAVAFAREYQRILQYVEASEADMYKGQMRFDINISLRPWGQKEMGQRSETKNVNSFKFMEAVIKYEIARQEKILEAGEIPDQETRGWDSEKGVTYLMRSKEDAHDYRYFPEPDVPPLTVSKEWREEIQGEVGELPAVKRERLIKEYSISAEDALQLTVDRATADYYEQVAKDSGDPKRAAAWVLTILGADLGEGQGVVDLGIEPNQLAELIKLIVDGKINNNTAKEKVYPVLRDKKKSPTEIVAELGLEQVSDSSAIEPIVDQVMADNPKAVEDLRGGEDKAIGFLVGQIMRQLKGQGNPAMINELIRQKM